MEEEAPTEKRMMNSMNHTKWILYNEIAEAYFESNIEDGVFYENSYLFSAVTYFRKKIHHRCLIVFGVPLV